MPHRYRRIPFYVSFFLLFFICVFCISYPLLSNYLYDTQNSELIASYDQAVLEKKENLGIGEELAACRSYNRILSSHLAVGEKEEDCLHEYPNRLNFDGSGMMGYLMIPKLELTLPLYHGTDAQTLESGLGHMEFTSLPVGGESTHAVITGHTGMSNKRLLTDLDQLEIGDSFTFRVCDESLTYQVDQIKTVLPEATQDLRIVEGKDYMTLVTCTPYGVNSHRLLVRGCRVTEEEAAEVSEDAGKEDSAAESSTWLKNYRKALRTGLLLFFFVMFSVWLIQKKRRAWFLFLLAFAIAVVSAIGIKEQLMEYQESEEYYGDFLQHTVQVRILPEDEKNAEALYPQEVTEEDVPLNIRFDDADGLAKALGEGKFAKTIGWIYGPGTAINYPIAFSGDNTYFLTHTPDGEERIAGSIFLDGRCQADFSGPHSILYGHCMRNGSMFGSLLNYKNQDYYDRYPYLWLITPERSWQLCIFAVCVADSEEEPEFWQTEFQERGDSRMENWLKKITGSSLIQPRYEVPERFSIVTLSTCSYEFDDAKCLVTGFLVPARE